MGTVGGSSDATVDRSTEIRAVLYTDLVGSTRSWERDAASMDHRLRAHDKLLAEQVLRHHGDRVSHTGDGVVAVFASVSDAVTTALEVQRRLPAIGLESRMGIHVGEAYPRDGNWFGPMMNRGARLMAIGHGGQILLSAAASTMLDAAHLDVELIDLGVHQLKDLAAPEHVRQLVAPGLPREFPPLRSLSARRGNLPSPTEELVGRAGDIDAIMAMLDRHRVVSIVGAGGTGKTRLALEVAQRRTGYPDGAWFVDLTTVAAGGAIDAAVAAVFGVTSAGGRPLADAIQAIVAPLDALVVLDNCEHVLDEVVRLVTRCDTGGARARFLLTSRQSLALPSEHVFLAPPLDDASARELFVRRAAAGGRHEALDDDAVTRLCRALDNLPLAIELAAARSRSLGVDTVLDRLDDRFRALGVARGRPDRQATLYGAVSWSYDLLEPIERHVFEELAVFAGSFSLDVAEAVCAEAGITAADVDDAVAALVERSMVAVVPGPSRRYRLLETIRAFAQGVQAERGTLGDARRRLRGVYAGVAAAIGAGLASPDSLRWAVTWDEEMPNLRAVHRDAVLAGDLETAFALIERLPVYLRGDEEAVAWPQATLAMPGAREHAQATDTALWLIAALLQQARMPEALAAIEELAGHGLTEAAAVPLRMRVWTMMGQRNEPTEFDTDYREARFAGGFVPAFSMVTAEKLTGRREIEGSARLRSIAEASGSPFHWMCVRALAFAGTAYLTGAELDEAVVATYDVHELAMAHRIRLPAGWALTARAMALTTSGSPRAPGAIADALSFWQDTTESFQVLVVALAAAGFLAATEGDLTWVPIVVGLFERMTGSAPPAASDLLAPARAALSGPEFERLAASGRSLSPRELAQRLIDRLTPRS